MISAFETLGGGFGGAFYSHMRAGPRLSGHAAVRPEFCTSACAAGAELSLSALLPEIPTWRSTGCV